MSNSSDILRKKLEELQSIVKVQSHLEGIKQSLMDKNKELEVVEKQMRKEENDVTVLEGKGVRPLFRKILGDKESQLEKERQEYLEISLKFNSLKDQIEVLEFEGDVLQKKVLNIKTVEQEVETLKDLREREILSGLESSLQNELRLIIHKMDNMVILKREIRESIDAGAISSRYLVELANLLKQVLNWGTWPSQSTYNEMVKRSRIAQASKLVAKVQYQLNKFGKEMEDLGEQNMYFKLDKGGMANFSSYFFDNLITDWIIQKKIKNSLNNVMLTNDRIVRTVQSLNHELEKIDRSMSELQVQRDHLITT